MDHLVSDLFFRTHTILYTKYLSRISLSVNVYFAKLANKLKTKQRVCGQTVACCFDYF